MGFEADITQAVGSTGNQTQILIGEKEAFKSPRLVNLTEPYKSDGSGGDFPKYQPAISGLDLAFLTTLIESGVFTGSRARSAGYPGQLRGEGGFVAGSSPLVIPLLVRNLMQDKNPRYHILGGTGTTLPSAVDVVDAQPLAGNAEKTIADDLSSTVNVVQLEVTPKEGTEQTVTVVAGESLDTDGEIDVAEDLSGYHGAFALTVTPDSSADLASATTPAEIIITGLDANDGNQSLTLEFPNTAKTTAQKPTETFTEVTGVTVNGWSAGTVTITVTIAADLAIADNVEVATLRIEGLDNRDRPIAQTFSFDDENKDVLQKSDGFFKQVTKVLPSGWAGGAFDITAQDKAVRVYIEAQDGEPVCFLSGEISRGLIPALIDDMLIRQLTLALTPEELIRFAVQTIYREELDQQNLAGDTGAMARKSDASQLEFPSEDFFVGFQAVLIIDGVVAPAKSVTLTINQNWQHVGGLSGEQTDEGLPIAITREASLTGDFVYATQNNLNRDFINNRKFNKLEVRITNKLEGAFPAQIRVLMAKGQLEVNPVPTFTDPGEITQGYQIRVLPSTIGAADDVRWILDIPEHQPLRDYS